MPILPMLVPGAGRPFATPSRVHVFPPSLERYTPEPSPPYVRRLGWRRWSHIVTYIRWGLEGSMAMSDAPVVGVSPARISCHVFPPSLDRYRPRSPPGLNRWPVAATKMVLGFVGWTTISEMR